MMLMHQVMKKTFYNLNNINMENLDNRADLLNDELLNFWKELNFLREWFGSQVLATLDEWDSYEDDTKNDKALGITQWVQDFNVDYSKLTSGEKKLWETLCDSWRWYMLKPVLDDNNKRLEIYNLLEKVQLG